MLKYERLPKRLRVLAKKASNISYMSIQSSLFTSIVIEKRSFLTKTVI